MIAANQIAFGGSKRKPISYDGLNAFTIEITDDYKEFHFTEGKFAAGSSHTQSAIFLASGSSSFSIDWGDGIVETYDKDSKEGMFHRYSKNGTYVIIISDDIQSFHVSKNLNIRNVLSIGYKNTFKPFYWAGVSGSVGGFFDSSGIEKFFVGSGVIDNLYASMFYRCSNLKEIELGNSVISTIYQSALTMTALTGVLEFRKGLKEIKTQAFQDCGNISRLILPSTLTSVTYAAFYRTKMDIVLKGVSPPSIDTSLLGAGSFYVPDEAYDAYLATEYGHRCKKMSELPPI